MSGTAHDDHDERAGDEADATEADVRLNDRSDYQLCYACGARNPHSLGLVFHREGEESSRCSRRTSATRAFQVWCTEVCWRRCWMKRWSASR